MTSVVSISRLAVNLRYRKYLAVLIMSGTAQSASMPVVSLYANKVLGLGKSQIGILWMSIVIGSLISISVGHLSDRIHVSIPFVRYAGIWLALGWASLAFARNFAEVIVIFALSLSTSSVLNSQIFTALESVMTESGEPRRALVTSTLRTGYSVGYIIGPIIGALLITAVSFRAVFFVTSALFLLIVLTSGDIRKHIPGEGKPARAAESGVRKSSLFALLLVCACVSFVLIGDFMKDSYLSLYVVDVLKKPILLYSSVIAAGAVLELLAFPVLGLIADRFGSPPVIAFGLFLAIGDYGVLALAPQVWSVIVSQILHVLVVATVYGVTAAYAQSLMAGRAGIATASYFASISLAQIAGGALGAAFVNVLGVRALFWLPSAAALLALLAFIVLETSLLGWRRGQFGSA